jgi:ATP-dependent DNA ligase
MHADLDIAGRRWQRRQQTVVVWIFWVELRVELGVERNRQ